MENRIRHISETDISAIEEQYAENSCILKLDGRRIQTESDWLYNMAELFMFPVYTENGNIPWFRGAFEKQGEHFMNWHRYDDWMSDLEWLGTDSVVLIIEHFSEMLRNEPEVKEYVMNDLKNTVLPWWESEVVNCVVEGKRKSFNVYLVDDNSVITDSL